MADADNNPNVAQGATDESTLDDQLVAAFDELSESLAQNGAGDDGEPEPESEPAGNDDDGASLEDGFSGADEGGEVDPEPDAESGDGTSAEGDPDAAGEGEPTQEPVKTEPEPQSKPEPKPDRKTERALKELEKALKDDGYTSVYGKIAEFTGETEDEVKARIESDELTTEEKAALYDAEHAQTKAAEQADAERRGREMVLQALYAEFPTIKDTVKDLDKDIKNPDRFLKLLLAGNTPREAFLATGNVPPRSAPTPNGKSHLVPDIRSKRGGDTVSVPASELQMYRDMFPDANDKEIEQLYKRAKT
ncbi:MAG: hypothetical protein J5958_06535 [Clostridia bacterium]|nr:hypothetical protein [Clostridia bacterium]